MSAKIFFTYPSSQASKDIWNVPLSLKIKNVVRRILPTSHKKRKESVKIWLAENRKMKSLTKSDFPLIFVVHNGRRFLPSFLKHYRSIGVTRFVCVDDASDDGTTQYLLEQPDVNVHFSNVRYREAARSKTWRELLAAKYGKNRWYLNVDVDEYLFTGNNSEMTISEYADILFSKGIKRLPAPMIDMVPEGDISEAILDSDDIMPWEVCEFFDLEGYSGHADKGGIKLFGGPRKRLWDADAELIKYPLIYWDKNTSMGVSVHSPRPAYRNYAPVCGALLHFKIFSDIETVSTAAIESGQYYEGSREYKLMYEYFKDNQFKRLTCESSVRFEDEKTLLNYGFIALPTEYLS